MKLLMIILFSFQSVEVPIDYYFDDSKSTVYFLYKNKIDSYSIETDFQLKSSIELKNPNLYDLSKFKFINQHQLSSKLGGAILKIKGDSIFRIDDSYEHKMQLGSVEFVRNDTLIRYGGYGFFQNRNFFTFYDKQTNGWEFLDINGSVIPDNLFGFQHFLIKDNLIICGGYKLDRFKNDIRYKNYNCYEFDFYSKKWKVLGSLNDHIEKMKNSFLYNNNTQITFNNGKMYKINYKSNLVESFYPNPLTKKVESSNFTPFNHNNQLYYFEIKNNKLHLKSLGFEDFETSLKNEEKTNLYKTSNFIYILLPIILVISTTIMYRFFRRYVNKIVNFNKVYFFNLTRIPLNGVEEILFSTLVNSSKIKSKVENRAIMDIYSVQSLDYGTITRRKNESINKLNDKLKILFKTNRNVIVREYSNIDRRQINYFINPHFI